MRMPKTRTRQGSRVKRRALGRPARLWRRSRRAYANMNMYIYFGPDRVWQEADVLLQSAVSSSHKSALQPAHPYCTARL